MSEKRIGLALIVSEQTPPHVASIMHFMERHSPAASKIYIVHTKDARSVKPASRIYSFACKRYENYPVKIQKLEVPTDPSKIFRLVEILDGDPEVDHYFVNATGGNKLMTLGLAHSCAKTDRFTVLYGELDSKQTTQWSRVWDKGSGKLATEPFAIDMSLIDRLDVRDVVGMQLDLEADERLEISDVPNISVQEVLDLVRNDQRSMVQVLQTKGIGVEKVGDTLEVWTAALVRLMGVEPKANLIRFKNAVSQQETDVVFVRNGVLHILDCKLPVAGEKDKPVVHLHEAYSTKNRYGGLSTRYALVRPKMPFPPEAKAILAGLRIVLFDPASCRRLAESISKFAGLEYTDAAKKVDDEVDRLLKEGIRFYGKGGRTGAPEKEADPIADALPLDETVGEMLDGRRAAIIDLRGMLMVVAPTTADDLVRQKIESLMPENCFFVVTSKTPRWNVWVAKAAGGLNTGRIRDILRNL